MSGNTTSALSSTECMYIDDRDRRFPNRLTLASSCAIACVLLSTIPANAGWRKTFARTVLPSLVRRAAVSLIQQELYDLESDHPSKYPQVPDTSSRTISPAANLIMPRSRFTPMPSSAVAQSFQQGLGGNCSYEQLVSAKVFESNPLHGSVFKRQARVRYIILHSTETGSPADARRVIQSWNNRGLRHPGAQFVVDRNGTICSTTNPDMATVHIDTSKTLAGYSNDNSVGIEIVRSGKQQYTRSQLDSVTCLVSYLQEHYGVPDSNVTTHHHVQPSDRSDPVGFDLVAFEADKSALRRPALARGARFDDPVHSAISPDAKQVLSTMPKPAPDFRLRRN